LRAIALTQPIAVGETYELIGDKAHHLVRVIRLKLNEKVLGLNGHGKKSYLQVIQLNKKTLKLKCLKIEELQTPLYNIDLAVAQIKKDAMDLSIKVACELGLGKIIICETDFSQKIKLNPERINKLIESSVEQSNNPFFPIIELNAFKDIFSKDYDELIYFSSIVQESNTFKHDPQKKYLLIIGPEGGYSHLEEKLIIDNGAKIINLDTPIMRTQNAIPCAVGYLLGRI
jgi:16S rRNA (uracil1498-N3)-methyltransferase